MILPAPSVAALAGLLFGSFLNVCIARLPEHRSILWPGSHCPHCSAAIRPYDNVPLVSFAVLRGRCRACKASIHWRYPLTEAALALLWFCCAATFPYPAAMAAAVFCFFCLGLLAMDAETFRLPDAFTLPGAALGFAAAWLPGGGLPKHLHLLGQAPFSIPALSSQASSLLGAAVGFGTLFTIRLAYKATRKQEGMGLGDVKLAAMLGAWLGPAGVVLTLVLGVLLGVLLATLYLRSDKQEGSATAVPFGVALCLGGMLTLFFGAAFCNQYFRFWP